MSSDARQGVFWIALPLVGYVLILPIQMDRLPDEGGILAGWIFGGAVGAAAAWAYVASWRRWRPDAGRSDNTTMTSSTPLYLLMGIIAIVGLVLGDVAKTVVVSGFCTSASVGLFLERHR
jgi:hypothetical protein